ncbi:DnaD domain protein [Clostridium sp. JN-1]|uniref:DnaD domain-containing protein n=1 Tax=Clostridium sp. JN-1 TaxID=2483110 RepID=UPI000F0AFD4C|nr:DnaD domain protein [Clostridium sp. JN-1]
MAKYRQLHTDFWNDGFVLDLTPEEKFFYIYLMTNSNTTQCGIYELPKRIIETQTGYNRETVDKLLLRFQEYKKIQYFDETKEIIILNWLKYNKPNNLNAIKCVNKELRNVKNRAFISIFYKQCLKEELDIENIFNGIEINVDDSNNQITEANNPLLSPLQGDTNTLISKEVINNKQEIINNKQGVRSNKYACTEAPCKSYCDVLTFFESSVHAADEAERKKLHIWSGFIDCDVIIEAIKEALKYNARNINYIGKILKSWQGRGIKTVSDIKAYKNIWESKSGKSSSDRHYDFKELEKKLLGCGNG